MAPKDYFDELWMRCDGLSSIYVFMERNAASVIRPEEILRAEWVARVSALDLYVHELVCQRMLRIFFGEIARPKRFDSFKIPLNVAAQIYDAHDNFSSRSIFDLEVRRQLSYVSYQAPDKIAEGVKMCSDLDLWESVALHQRRCGGGVMAKDIKRQLSMVVDRRNKIAHEGDMQPTAPRDPWGISKEDLINVSRFIKDLVESIDYCVNNDFGLLGKR